MMNPGNILLHPRRCAEGIRTQPRILLPGAIVLAVSIVLFSAGYADAASGTAAHVPSSATPEERAAVDAAIRSEYLRNLLFLPIRLLLGWSTFAFALFLSARTFSRAEGIRFVHFLSLEIHAEAILLIGGAGALFHVRVPGLDLIDPGVGPFLTALLTSINLTTLWYLLVLITGLSVLCGSRIRTAALAAGVVWASALALNAGILAFLTRVYSFWQ